MKDINVINDNNKIDLSSLNKFLISKGDEYLEYLLISNVYNKNITEDKIREYVLKGYNIKEELLKFVTKDKELYSYISLMNKVLEEIYKENSSEEDTEFYILPLDFIKSNKYFSIDKFFSVYGGYAIRFIPYELQTKELWEFSALKSPYFISDDSFPQEYKSYNLFLKLIEIESSLIYDAADSNIFNKDEIYNLFEFTYKKYIKENNVSEFWKTHRYNPLDFKDIYLKLASNFKHESYLKKYGIPDIHDVPRFAFNESKSLLKEETLLDKFKLMDENKIDLFSLNKFLLSKEDNLLEYLLLENNLIFGLDENKIRNFILKGYKPLETFPNNIKIDMDLKEYVNVLLTFESIKYIPNEKYTVSYAKLKDNKYISIEGLLKYNSLFIRYIPENLLTQEICNNVYNKNYRIFREIPNRFKTYEMCENVIGKNAYFFVYLPDPLDNGTLITVQECYKLLKLAHTYYIDKDKFSNGVEQFWSDAIVSKLDRDYFVRLMYEVNAQEYVGKYGQGGIKKNNNLQESNSLLKEEEFFNVEQLEYDSDKNKIDLQELSEFLYNNGDDYLEYLLANKEYIKVDSKNVFRLYKNKNFKDVTEFLNIGYDFLNVILTDPIEKNKIEQFYLKNRYPHDYPDILWESRAFCEAALIKQKSCLYKVPLKFRDYKMCKLAVSFDGDNIKSVPENIENYYSLCEMAVSQRAWSLMLIDKNKWDYNLYEKAVSQNGGVLFYIPEKYRDYNLCEKAVSSEPSSIYDVPKNIENYYSLIKLAYSKDKTVILDMNLPKEYFDKLKNDFPKDFNLQESKSLLKEGITDEVYHFTTYQSAAEILQYNRFKFSIETEGDSLSRMNNYKNYMSVSRTKSLNKGFFNTIKNGVNLVIRFKLDGRKLAQKYKGIPFNYFPAWGKENYAFEYEDRLLSNDEYIENFSKYLLSVDIIDLTIGNNINKTKIHTIKELSQKLNLVCNVYKHDDNNIVRKQFQSDPINFIKNKGTFVLNDSFFTKEIVDEIYNHFKENIYTYIRLSQIPAEFRNYELCELYIKKNPINIIGVPSPNNTLIKNNLISREEYMSLVRIAFSLDKNIIDYIPDEFEKILRDEINKASNNNLQESKSLLKEGITDEVYHFTSLENFIKIMNTNTFRFSDLLYDLSDVIHNTPLKKYKYYMSLSRTGSIKTGYGNYQSDNSNFIVRLKIDGRKLSQSYKGQPINYHNYGRKQKSSKKTSFRFEYEDRILSNKPTIENFSNYVLSVDIIKITNSSNNFLLDDDMKSLEYILKNKENYNAPINFTNEKNSPLNENKSLLKEGITDEVYHFTSLENLIRILKSNSLNLSFMDNDINQTWNRKDSNIHKTLNKYMYFLSLSRTKSIDKGYAQVLKSQNIPVITRIKLDGRKLSFNNKIIPFDYNQTISRNVNKNDKYFEYEDRLVSDKSSIKNINNYILEIDIFMYYNYDFQKDSFLFLKEYQNTTNIPIKVFNKVKNNSLNESKLLLKEDYTEEEVLEEISDKNKIDLISLNKFLKENNDDYLEYLLFYNDFLNIERNIIKIVKNKYITGFGSFPIKYLYQPKVIREIVLRNPELLERLNLYYLERMEDSKQEMKDIYKYAVINKPNMLSRIPTNLPYYDELLEVMFQKDRGNLFDLLIIQPKSIQQSNMLNKVISFLQNKGYTLGKNPS
jgi:hypothetical protein